jgi:hypothetical protein
MVKVRQRERVEAIKGVAAGLIDSIEVEHDIMTPCEDVRCGEVEISAIRQWSVTEIAADLLCCGLSCR